jgi:hypothetical protein
MSIMVECHSCGRRFQAPPEFVGRRVKCKGCGVVFEVQAPPGLPAPEDAGDDFASLAPLEPSFADQNVENSNADGGPPRIGPRMETRIPAGDHVQDIPLYVPAALVGRPNVLNFHYNGAREVDQWLPLGLMIAGFAGLGLAASQQETNGIAWIAFVRFLIPCLLYVALIYPITLSMVRKAAREMRYQVPPQPKLRVFASYMPAFALTAGLWLAGGGLSVGQIFGAVLGLALSSGALWLLFRLRNEEISTTVAHGAGGFAIGLGISVALILSLNLLAGAIVTQSKAQASLPVSPFGPGLSWAAPVQAVAIKPKPAPVIAPPIQPSDASATPPASLVALERDRIPGPIDQVIRPLSRASTIGIVRHANNADVIEPWDTQTWQQLPGTLQLSTPHQGNFVISTDGQSLAWIAEWPRFSVQIWSFTDGSGRPRIIDLDKSLGEPELIGFITPDHLLIQWLGGKPKPAQPATVQPAPVGPARIESPTPPLRPLPTRARPVHSTPSLFDSDFQIAPADPVSPTPANTSSDHPDTGQMLQILSTNGNAIGQLTTPTLLSDTGHGSPNFAISTAAQRLIVVSKIGDAPALLQYDLARGVALPPIKIREIDPSFAAAPTGMAYSNDGKHLAVLYEHGGGAVVLSYDANTETKPQEFDYPSDPFDSAQGDEFTGNAIAWLDPSPFWTIRGRGLVDAQAGIHLKAADFNVPHVIGQRVLDGDRIELITAGNNAKQITVVTFDRLQLQSPSPVATSQP